MLELKKNQLKESRRPGWLRPLLVQTARPVKVLVMTLLEMGPAEMRPRQARVLLPVLTLPPVRVLQGSLVKKLVEAVQKSAAAATRSRGVANAAKREAVRLLRTKIIKP